MEQSTEDLLAKAHTAIQLLTRCNTEKPSPEDVEALREKLKATPGL